MIAALAALTLLVPGDFDAESGAWNGVRYLATTAAEAKVGPGCPDACRPLTVLSELDWSTVKATDVLIFVQPTSGVDSEELLEFVHDGGTAIVAVDRGTSDSLVRAFGLRMAEGPVIHDDYFRDHPAFPRVSAPAVCSQGRSQAELPEGCHFLWYNVRARANAPRDYGLVLNHPAALTIDPDARDRWERSVIIPFAEPQQAFAVEVQVGSGYALFLSDASVFINDMQRRAYGDKQFVANVMRYYCEDNCDVKIVLPGTAVGGRYPSRSRRGLGGLEEIFAVGIEELNDLGARVNVWLGTESTLVALAVILLALLLLALGVLPWPSGIPRPVWQTQARYRSSHVDYWVQALSRARSSADFSQAALALADRFDRATGRAGGAGASPAALRCVQTFNKVRARSSNKVGVGVDDATAHAATEWPEWRMDLEEFQRLWMDCETVLNQLPEQRPPRTR